MSKVIVGFDSREESNDALVLGSALAGAYDAELHVAIVLPRGELPFERALLSSPISDQLDANLYESAEWILGNGEFVRASLDGELGGRSAARALHEYAAQQGADLIAVGSCHRGKLGRILPGSVGESLLRGAPCAVAVAPRGFARQDHTSFALIGIAYDGSPEADLALATGERLAEALDAELRVITAVPSVGTYFPNSDVMNALIEDHHRFYRHASERGRSQLPPGASVEAVLEEGDPAALLAEQGIDLDLLVMGSRGYGPLRSALLGAISSAVMRTAPCPVLVTPRGLTERDEQAKVADRQLATDT
jgi:nucleotide-binding universal stress UspA family protein